MDENKKETEKTAGKYDVFISYRCEGGIETAKRVHEALTQRGYQVFLEIDSLRSGPFNEQEYDVIDSASDFVFILSPGALDPCVNGDDWVRNELTRALQQKKNIVPIILKDASFPSPMPQGLEELQGFASMEDSNEAMDKLAGMLKGKPQINNNGQILDNKNVTKKLTGKYDVFISYRRDGGVDTARSVYQALEKRGYRVFFDLESMRSGPFNKQLYDVIDSAQDFVLILSKNSLDRCKNYGDWVREEILEAIKSNKNIIPFMQKDFEWPDPMPKGMEKLPFIQGIPPSQEYFDAAINNMAKKLLKAWPVRKIWKIIAFLFLVIALAFSGLSYLGYIQEKEEIVARRQARIEQEKRDAERRQREEEAERQNRQKLEAAQAAAAKAKLEAEHKLAEARVEQERQRLETERKLAEARVQQERQRLETERKLAEARIAEAKAKLEAEKAERARIEAQVRADREAAAAKAKLEAAAREQARLAAERKAKAEAEAREQERLAAERKAKLEAAAREQARLAAENKARAEADVRARLEAERKAKAEAAARERARPKSKREAWIEKADPEVKMAFEYIKHANLQYPTLNDAVMAARCADVKALVTIRQNGFSDWKHPDIILAASRTPFRDNVQTIHELGGRLRTKDKHGKTVLMFAAEQPDNLETVKYLISSGADIDAEEKHGMNALMFAALANNVAIVDYLIGKGADINSKDEDGWSVLMMVSRIPQNIATVKYLVTHGVKIDAKARNGRNALMVAANTPDNLEIIKCLVSHGANVNATRNDGKTALMYAAMLPKNVEAVKYLANHGADINAKDEDGQTALMFASKEENTLETVKFLAGFRGVK